MGLALSATAQNDEALTHQHWFEERTEHFNIYSSGPAQEVAKLGGRLEQFRDAYGQLAGAQAVVSPPITVIVFPDLDAMQPYVPLYNGKPANLAGFFKHGTEEDIIVLALRGTNDVSLETIFHEYTHSLFRHNDNIWPVWLKEGMAEIYSTFEATGRGVRIGLPIEQHLRLLKGSELMPLSELLTVNNDSPQYNEADRQGIFYAESWLLTHFLMNGDNMAFRNRFGSYTTTYLRQGQPPDQALVNALGAPLKSIEAELRRYLERDQFEPLGYVVKIDLSAPRAMTTRPIGWSETCFLLGDELMRIGRPDEAETFFAESQKLSPTSPLAYEGLGLLAAEREKHAAAVQLLKQALERGSASFRAHYVYAEQLLAMSAESKDVYRRVESRTAAEIRSELLRSIKLMPSFGPAQELLGFFELVQGDDYASAEQHLRRAIQLEPEQQYYLIYLAEAQMRRQDTAGARRTLEPLTQAHVDAKLRQRAREILSQTNQPATPAP